MEYRKEKYVCVAGADCDKTKTLIYYSKRPTRDALNEKTATINNSTLLGNMTVNT